MSDDLKQRFRDFEVSPPPSAWLGIARHLGEQGEDLLIKELVLEAEIEPPARTWDFIANGKDMPGYKKIAFSAFRHLPKAAAIIGGLVIVGSFFLFNNKTKKTPLASVPSGMLKFNPATLSVSGAIRKPLIAKITSGLPKAGSIYSSLKSIKKTTPEIIRQPETAIVSEVQEHPLQEPVIAAKPIRNEWGDIIQDMRVIRKPNTNYVSVTSPNGTPTRISAKFAQFLLYLNGDNDTDTKEGVFHKSFLESLTWKARFQDWRTTLSQNTIIPTSTNFMDILELKDIILQHKDID